MEIIINRKGNKAVVVDSYLFRKDRAHTETITWRCSVGGCKSRCRTDLAMENLLIPPTPHLPFHESKTDSFLAMERARSTIKRKADEDPNQKPGKIACSEAIKYDSLSYKDVPNWQSLSIESGNPNNQLCHVALMMFLLHLKVLILVSWTWTCMSTIQKQGERTTFFNLMLAKLNN